jgi:hypothetical protein
LSVTESIPNHRQNSYLQLAAVAFAEMLATPKHEIGAVIRPLLAINVSLERLLTWTVVTPDP